MPVKRAGRPARARAREREKKRKEKRVEPMVVVEVLAPMETPQPKNHNELVTKLEVC